MIIELWEDVMATVFFRRQTIRANIWERTNR